MLYTCFVFAGMRSHGSVADTDGVTRVMPHEIRPGPELQHHLACLPAALLAASFTTRARNDGSIWLSVADVGPTWSVSWLKVSSYHINNGPFILKRESHLTDDWFSTLANVIFFNFLNLRQTFPKAPQTLFSFTKGSTCSQIVLPKFQNVQISRGSLTTMTFDQKTQTVTASPNIHQVMITYSPGSQNVRQLLAISVIFSPSNS